MKIKLFTLMLSFIVMTAAAQQRIIDERTMQKNCWSVNAFCRKGQIMLLILLNPS